MPLHEDVERGAAQGVIEVLDHDDFHAHRPESLESLDGVHQQRRRSAHKNRVRMGVERDHGRARAARGSLGDEALDQPGVPAMEPVERANGDQQRPVGSFQAQPARDRPHRSVSSPRLGPAHR